MRPMRFVALGIVSFVAVLMGTLLAPGTFVNRALSTVLCTVFSFNSTLCTVNLAKSSDRVVAATPPAVEKNIGDWLGSRSGEFDDKPTPLPPYPQEINRDYIRDEFRDDINNRNNLRNYSHDNLRQMQEEYESYKRQLDDGVKQSIRENCKSNEFIENHIENNLEKYFNDDIKSQNTPNQSSKPQSRLEQNLCRHPGKYAVFAKHPILGGNYGTEGSVADYLNLQREHEHIFFCENGQITHNIGFGTNALPWSPTGEGRFSYSQREIETGKAEDGGRIDDFQLNDDKRYDSDLMDSLIGNGNQCQLRTEGIYAGFINNCQGYAKRMRERYEAKLKLIQETCRKDKKDPNPTPTPTPKPCSSCGDPHLVTLDGQRYDHQAVGEFVLTRTKNRQFEIQVRESPYKNVKTASINSAVAMKVGDARVALYVNGFPDDQTSIPLRIDGKPVDLKGTQNLAGGGAVTQIGDRSWTVQWPTGEVATFQIEEAGGSKMINISTGVTENDRGQMEGLLGNFNGNRSDDFMTRDGRVIEENKEAMNVARSVLSNFNISQYIPIQLDKATELFLESIHNEFGDSWRITQSESLFDYPSGKNTDSFTNRAFPNGFVVLRMLAPQAVQKAEEACRQAEVPSDRLEDCLFDVAVTGEADFASVAANILKNEVKKRLEQEIRQRIPLPVPLPF